MEQMTERIETILARMTRQELEFCAKQATETVDRQARAIVALTHAQERRQRMLDSALHELEERVGGPEGRYRSMMHALLRILDFHVRKDGQCAWVGAGVIDVARAGLEGRMRTDGTYESEVE